MEYIFNITKAFYLNKFIETKQKLCDYFMSVIGKHISHPRVVVTGGNIQTKTKLLLSGYQLADLCGYSRDKWQLEFI